MKIPEILCLGLLLAIPARGQQSATSGPQAQPRKLGLPAALELANRQNLDLAAARLRQSVAQAGVRIAGQIPNPSVSFSASRDLPHESLLFDQPIELGFKRSRRMELARQQVGLTNVEIDTLVRQVRRRVRETYYAAVLARRQTGQRAQALDLAKRVHNIAKERFDAGDVPQLEVFQADLEVSRAQTEYEVARQRERVSYSQLSMVLNEPAVTIWEPETSLEEMPPRVSLEELVQRAQNLNPDLQHLNQEQKVELSRKALLQAQRIPNLDVQFGSDFNAPPDFRVGLRGGFAVALPLFSRNQGELAQQSATLRLLDAETAATRRAVAGRVEAAYFEWNTRQTQVELYRSTLLPAARRLQELAEESYRAGKANILTILDAQRNVQQVERDYLDSLSALQAAFAGLEETVGGPLD